MADFLAMRNDLEVEVKSLREQQGQQQAHRETTAAYFANAIEFERYDLSQKRAALSTSIAGVVIYPPTVTSNRKVDLHRIEVHWINGEVENLGQTADLDAAIEAARD